MAEKEKGQRRVYTLPTELVDRIVTYQTEMGLQSEVEAARRLLDDALRRRDSALTIARRFQERLKETRILADIARDVLMGHPLVTSIQMGDDVLAFTLNTGETVAVSRDGTVQIQDRRNMVRRFDANGKEEPDDAEVPF